MRIDVITIFPELIESWARVSLLGRLVARGAVDLRVHDPRERTEDAHRSVDDSPFGGGAGMVMRIEPIDRTLTDAGCPRPVIALGPAGQRVDQSIVARLAEGDGLTLICGRYEGIDQRVVDHLCDAELSIGDFVLNGGEAAAVALIEAVTRLLPGAMGNSDSPVDESFAHDRLEYPHYTRPAVYRTWAVPEVLRSGDHAAVAEWRAAQALLRTLQRRPDLVEKSGGLDATDRERLARWGSGSPASGER